MAANYNDLVRPVSTTDLDLDIVAVAPVYLVALTSHLVAYRRKALFDVVGGFLQPIVSE